MLNPKTSSLRERRDLFEGYRTGQGSALQPRSGISKSLLGGVDSIPLDPPQPGFNDGSFLRASPHQGRIGVELFEVAAYRNDVGDRHTTIEFEYRNRAIRIQGTERRGELFSVAQINLHGRHSKILLSKKNAHAARAGCRYAVVKFHEGLLAVERPAVDNRVTAADCVARLLPKDHRAACDQEVSKGSRAEVDTCQGC